MKIVWSNRALVDLDDIFQFYSLIASTDVAQKLTGKILNRVRILTSYPEVGIAESWGIELPFEYRSLIEGNYKIIYRIIDQTTILVARVFDTRMDPKKKTI
ncbi:type II toxin-antitoxin system RelE/ParE family toxin [Algoriphagus sp. H41]|uniref:Type II toxin-antitoxin system RelE/ParE family toxin n=1 Tax=Algoriphagus oliviformis TaxID=2811231 RepID=A0ABS3BXS5_9BACT|nr:type II toxin-antitoxin system RelE/ParE family toxin [Algoriphagus oliviformis]